MFKILAHGATNVGRERKNNEDAFRVAPDAGLYLVCDGMGGHASGEIASQIAADAMVRVVAEDMANPEFLWPAATPQGLGEEARILDAAVRIANGEVFSAASENSLHKGMGTTIVGMIAGPQRLGLVHVGDSRIYRMRGGELSQLTDDHSLLNFYIQTRPMSAEQIKQFAGKNVIVRAVGLRDAVEPDVQLQEYEDGDLYMMCSDGLTDMVDEAVVAATLQDCGDKLVATADLLIEHALAAGGKDNITVLLLRIVQEHDERKSRMAARNTLPMDIIDDETADVGEHMEDTSPGFDLRHGDPSDAETLTEIEVAQSGQRKHGRTQEVPYRPWKDFELNAPRKPGLPLPVRRPVSQGYGVDTSAPTDPMGVAASNALADAAKLLGTTPRGTSPAAILSELEMRGIDPRVARDSASDPNVTGSERNVAYAVTQKATVPAGLPPFRPSAPSVGGAATPAATGDEIDPDMAETIRPDSGLTSSVSAALRAVGVHVSTEVDEALAATSFKPSDVVVAGTESAAGGSPTGYREDTERVVRPASGATGTAATASAGDIAASTEPVRSAATSMRATAVDRPNPLRPSDVQPPQVVAKAVEGDAKPAAKSADLRGMPPANPLTALDMDALPEGLPLDEDDEPSF